MANVNDGAIGYASRHLDFYPPTTPGSSGVKTSYSGATKKLTAVMESISVTRPAFKVNYYNESRAPGGAYTNDDFVEGSGTVQLPGDPSLVSPVTKSLVPGDAFNCVLDQTIGAEQFFIVSVDSPESQSTYKTQNVRFQKFINVTNVPATV